MSTSPDSGEWAELGVPQREIEGWKSDGFSPFEAAVAHGDGFTPLIAVHYQRQLRKTAAAWQRSGLDTAEGLSWHRAGFTAKEAVKWREAGIDLETARAARHGPRNAAIASSREE